MAYRRAVQQYGKPALRWLAAGEGACSSGCVDAVQVGAARAPAGQSAVFRSFSAGRFAQAETTGASTTEAAVAAFQRAKGAPVHLYASVGGALGAAAGIYYLLFGGSKAPVAQAEAPLGVGAAHVGEYSVQTHTGAQFSHTELQDNFAIVYFGTTTDRDCVSELEKLGEVVQQSDRKTNMHYLVPLFVTVDIDTDNEEKMRNVVDLFNVNHNRKNVRLVGLTGPDTVKLHQAAVEYSGKSGPSPDHADNRIYLVNPEGEFVKAFNPSASVAEISDELQEAITKYKVNHASWHAPKKVARRHA